MSTQISTHFTLEEAVFSSTAQRLGIDNTPSTQIEDNIRDAAGGMEQVRDLLDSPVHVDSWYRCAKLNAAVHGAKDSAHMQGYAVDFMCPAFGTPLEIVDAIMHSSIEFDQCIQEGTWVHISFAPALRRQVLTAHFNTNGGTTYTLGV